jgi:hypothetical protein
MSDDDMYWPDKYPWSRRPAPRRPVTAVAGWSAAGPGAAVHGTSAPPAPTGTPPAAGATTAASGRPER